MAKKEDYNSLLIKHPTNPMLCYYLTMRTTTREVYPIARFQAYYMNGNDRIEKKFLGLKELYELYFLTHRIIMLMEDYYAGDLDLGSLLNISLDVTSEEKIVVDI